MKNLLAVSSIVELFSSGVLQLFILFCSTIVQSQTTSYNKPLSFSDYIVYLD